MGVSLSYRTTAPVSAKIKAAILADVERINAERSWWCEGIIFFEERKGAKHLTGDTKLFFAGFYSDEEAEDGLQEVDADDDQFMGFRDAAFILRQLMRWLGTHGIGRINLGAKRAGKRSVGKPPAPFDVAGLETGSQRGC
ncbi:MAG TPA: hypothetical protein VH682_10885 [Gemmataceae bacterium]